MQGRHEGLSCARQISLQVVNARAVDLSAKGFNRFFDAWHGSHAGYTRPATSYALALGLVGLASIARWFALGIIPGAPFIFYIPVIAAIAYLGGFWPGLFAASLSVTIASVLFSPPEGSLADEGSGAAWRAGLALLIGAAVAGLIHRIRMDQLRLATQKGRADLLMHELQHRVANNIQLMAGLVTLQAQRSECAREELAAVSRRLVILGQLYRRLSALGHEKKIDFGGFAESVARGMVGAVAGPGVELHTDIAPLEIDRELALPLGLILAELITNALKHGIAAGNGTVRIRLCRGQDGRYALEVANREQQPAVAAPVARACSGLTIIAGLAEQVGAQLTRLSRDGETRVEVRFAA